MKKRLLSLVLAFVMLLSLLPVATYAAEPVVNYVTDETVYTNSGSVSKYSDVVKNWGTRGELATFLSPMAESFYGDLTYEALADYSFAQLQALMAENHTTLTKYDDDTKYLLAYTDCQDSGYYISCFYSGDHIGPAWDGGLTWNREHTWPQSKISNDSTGYAVQDIMMIRPTASQYNSGRNNTAYGESSGYYHPNSYANGQDLRGDAARSVLYGYVRWDMGDTMWGTEGVMESEQVLLQWMAEDPVDTWEMARNDSVQSITGTRNIFIDYPELAYVVLGEDVPTDLYTPSGEANTPSYTVTASSGNEALGTVHVNDNAVSAFPASGCEVTGYTVLSGEVHVTRTGDVFLVDGACTIRIEFAQIEETAVRYIENGTVVSAADAAPGDVVLMPEYSGAAPEGYTFYGWLPYSLESTADGPEEFYLPGDPYTVERGINDLYALYTYVDMSLGGEQWELVTDASQLCAGTKVVVVSAAADVALSTTQNTNNRGTAAITKNADSTVSWTGTAIQELTLETGSVSGTWGLNTGSGYLYAASSTKNWLRTKSSLDSNASWSVTVTSAGVATVKAQGSYTRNWMRYNSQSNIFACYASSQGDINLYRAVAGGTTMYTTLNALSQEQELFAVYTAQQENGTYSSLQEALAACDPTVSYIKLLGDAETDTVLDRDLYMDLNGYSISGIIEPGSCGVYCMDQSTDQYTCEDMGWFSCVDEQGSAVVPEMMLRTALTGTVKRYLRIETENGYTFHRFYMGITHANLRPSTKGVGYKAVFAGDDMVLCAVESFGYTLQLGDHTPYTVTKSGTELVSMTPVTLRVENYDAENMGTTELTASVHMVIDGETFSGAEISIMLKELVEQINEANNLTDAQRTALSAWIAQSKTMQSWNVENIYTAE